MRMRKGREVSASFLASLVHDESLGLVEELWQFSATETNQQRLCKRRDAEGVSDAGMNRQGKECHLDKPGYVPVLGQEEDETLKAAKHCWSKRCCFSS